MGWFKKKFIEPQEQRTGEDRTAELKKDFDNKSVEAKANFIHRLFVQGVNILIENVFVESSFENAEDGAFIQKMKFKAIKERDKLESHDPSQELAQVQDLLEKIGCEVGILREEYLHPMRGPVETIRFKVSYEQIRTYKEFK